MQLAEERRQHIVDTVEQQGRVLAAELAQRFNTSEDTIRRDLRDLDAAGLLRRVHGGAMRRTQPVPSFGQRLDADEARKEVLARALADSVQSGDTVLVDAGTTNLAFARQLEDGRAATIITNSPQIALGLGHLRITRVVLLGGVYCAHVGAVITARAERPAAACGCQTMKVATLSAPGATALPGAPMVWPSSLRTGWFDVL